MDVTKGPCGVQANDAVGIIQAFNESGDRVARYRSEFGQGIDRGVADFKIVVSQQCDEGRHGGLGVRIQSQQAVQAEIAAMSECLFVIGECRQSEAVAPDGGQPTKQIGFER